MAEEWIECAKDAIRADARHAYDMCKDTAEKEKVDLWWVVEEFKKEFERMAKNV